MGWENKKIPWWKGIRWVKNQGFWKGHYRQRKAGGQRGHTQMCEDNRFV